MVVRLPHDVPQPSAIEREIASCRRQIAHLAEILSDRPDEATAQSLRDEIVFTRNRITELAHLLMLSRTRHRGVEA